MPPQFDSGSGGDAEGGLEGPDSQTELEDDTGPAQERKLRRDARSDPMEDQTEPADPGSAPQTSARPVSGSGGSGAASGASAGGATGEQTGPGPEGGPQTASGPGRVQSGQQSGPTPEETTVATGGADDPRVSTGTPGDAGAPSGRRAPPPESRDQGTPVDPGDRPEVARHFEQEFEQQTGREIEAGDDFTIRRVGDRFVATPSGGLIAAESREAAREQGRDLTEPTDTQFGSGEGPGVESGGVEVSTDFFDRSPGEAVPNRGSIDVEAVEDLGDQRDAAREQAEQTASARLSGAASASSALANQQQEEQFGDIDWSFGLGDPEEDEVEQALADASETIQGAGQTAASNLFDEGGIASRSIIAEGLRRAGEPERATQVEENLRGFGKGLAQSPFLIGDVPGLAGGVLEGVEYGQYLATTEPDVAFRESEGRATQIAEDVEEQVRAEPAQFTGLAVGSLGASFAVMRGASAIGPRAGLASRYAIQPGEELAGSAGYRITRRAAGTRAAERLFPNREPLIFSEEAAIRIGRRLGGRARVEATRTRERATDAVLGEPETQIEYDPTRYDPIQRTTARPGVRTQASRAVRRAEDAFSGRTYAGIPIPRSEVRTETEVSSGTEVSTRAETQSLVDDLEGPLRRMEESRIRELERADPIGEPSGRPTRYRVSPTEPELSPLYRSELETEARTDAGTRLELAQQPLADSRTGLDVMTDTRSDVIAAEMSQGDLAQELGVELEGGQETRLDLELELESEVETDLFTEYRQDLELEQELETEVELEGRNEVEAEPFWIRDRRTNAEDTGAGFTGTSRLLERDLLNPFTGR